MKRLFSSLLAICVIACTQEQSEIILDVLPEGKSHVIPVERALESLNGFMGDSLGTKGNVKYSVSTVYSDRTVTKLSDESPGELLYLVNFDDGDGYAVLAADDRISADVIAVVESGSISTDNFTSNSTQNRTI